MINWQELHHPFKFYVMFLDGQYVVKEIEADTQPYDYVSRHKTFKAADRARHLCQYKLDNWNEVSHTPLMTFRTVNGEITREPLKIGAPRGTRRYDK